MARGAKKDGESPKSNAGGPAGARDRRSKAPSPAAAGSKDAGGPAAKAARGDAARSNAAKPPKNDRELLDMAQAIEMLKTTRPTFYRWLRSGKLTGMKVGRQWRFYREDIERFLRGQSPRIDLPADIGPLCAQLREKVRQYGSEPAADEGGDPALAAVRLMLQAAATAEASDLHLSAGSEQACVRVRIDGRLYPAAAYDLRLHAAIIAAWKTLASCDIHETQLPQDGRILIDLPGIASRVDIRVSFVPATGGEAVTARVLRRGLLDLSLERLEYPAGDHRKLVRHLESPSGLIVITGPTGSGKTTTLYSCLSHLNRSDRKLVSAEDPVELNLDGVVQVSVRPHPSRTFPAVCRALFRTDPDVILVGEIRDRDTAIICAQMALTGHLTLTSLHTLDAPSALVRLVDIGVEPFVVGDAVRLVIGQRLVRALCRACSEPAAPDTTLMDEARRLASSGGLDWDRLEPAWRQPVGCPECKQTGYRGRLTVVELLEVTPEISAAVGRSGGAAELRAIAIAQGMPTMAAHAVQRAAAGETSLAEAIHVVADILSK